MVKYPETVIEGATYENKQSKDRVVAWHVSDYRVVRYSPQNGATGREYRLPEAEFLEQFSRVDEKQPRATENNKDGTEKA